MNKINELKSKIDAKGAELDALFATDNPTQETLAAAKMLEAELEHMTADLDAAKSFEDLRRARAMAGETAEAFELPQAKSISEFKTLGQAITEAELYAVKGGRTVEFGDIDIKTLLSTANGIPANNRQPNRIAEAIIRRPRIFDVIDMIPVDVGVWKVPAETYTNNAAEKAESVQGTLAAYAESADTFSDVTVNIRNVGHTLPVSEEQLEDYPNLGFWLDKRLTDGLLAKVESQMIVGAGTGATIKGISAFANVNTPVRAEDDIIVEGLFNGINKIRENGEAEPSVVFLNPANWAQIVLAKDNGGFVFNPAGTPFYTFAGIPIIVSSALPSNKYLAFDREYVYGLNRRGVTVTVADTEASNFINGVKTFRASCRVAVMVERGQAVTYGDLTAVNES